MMLAYEPVENLFEGVDLLQTLIRNIGDASIGKIRSQAEN
jgi:hypothetical protein